jgi:hypothetical protein
MVNGRCRKKIQASTHQAANSATLVWLNENRKWLRAHKVELIKQGKKDHEDRDY